MSGNDGWDDEDDDLAWGDDDWDDDIDEDDDLADLDEGADAGPGAVDEPRPRRTLVATPIVSTPEPLPYDDPYDNGGYRDEYDDRPYDDGVRSSRAWAIAAVLLLLIGAGVALALVLSSDDDSGQSASDVDTESSSTTQTTFNLGLPGDGGSSTSTSLGTATTSAAGGAGAASGSSTTSSTVKASTSTTKPEDTNDPACSARGTGASAPDNQPMQVSFCLDDGSPKVGQLVKVSGTAVDPDAQIEPECIKVSWEGEQFGECTPLTVSENPVINRDFSFTHTFTKPGTYTIHVGAISDAPKGSFAETTLKITVHA